MLEEKAQELKTQFDENGFVQVNALFGKDEVLQIRREVARYQQAVAPTIDKFDRIEKHDEPGKFSLMGRMDKYDTFFYELLHDPRLLHLAEVLLGREVTTQHLQFFNIIPNYGGPTPPHQDAYNFLIDPSEAVAVWIPLTPITPENGCLRYVPGSHKKGHRPHVKKFTSTFIVEPYTDSDVGNEVAVHPQPSDVVAHHCFTIHKSEPNRSSHERWAIAAIYYTKEFQVVPSREDWLQKYGRSTCGQWEQLQP